MTTNAIEVAGLQKSFGKKQALTDIQLNVEPGEFVALIGPSGSGKSTLLRHISGLVAGDRKGGTVDIFGQQVQHRGRVSGNIRSIRAEVGFIFQQFNLVNRLTLLENVMVGMLNRVPTWRSIPRLFTREEKLSALQALYRVGLHEHADQRASTLSGGQQQRAAIARTMEQQARIILADEPIASLDPESARMVMDCLAELNREKQVTIVISLHQVQFALKYCHRSVALKNGRIIYDGPSRDLTPAVLKKIYGTSGQTALDGTTPLSGAEVQRAKVLPGFTGQRPVPAGLARISH